MTATDQPRCRRCHRALGRKQVVTTRVGTFCPRHADRIAPHLRSRAGGRRMIAAPGVAGVPSPLPTADTSRHSDPAPSGPETSQP